MSLSGNLKLIETAKVLCRELRKNATHAEKIFWEVVRDRKFFNKKFYRQQPLFFDYIGRETFYIADFYCHENNMAVEIDGGHHKRQKNYDLLRTEVINALGIKVVRFTNEEVELEINKVLSKLKVELTN